jgi:hypothetical protein
MTPTPEAETHCYNRFWGPAESTQITHMMNFLKA